MLHLHPVPAFADNYLWLLHDQQHAWVVDPGDAAPVQAYLQQHGLALQGILITHRHHDHVDGVAELRQRWNCPVFGPAFEEVPEPLQRVAGSETLPVLGLNVQVLAVPGHTSGHVAYFAEVPDQAPVLFCGDSLFSAGCGRQFDGTLAQMHESLQRLATLPDATRVCCAHEYTLSNLRFAQAVEPDNADITAHTQHCQALRTHNQPTLPSTLALEKRINPFLRCQVPAVQAMARTQAHTPLEVFTALREWKNRF